MSETAHHSAHNRAVDATASRADSLGLGQRLRAAFTGDVRAPYGRGPSTSDPHSRRPAAALGEPRSVQEIVIALKQETGRAGFDLKIGQDRRIEGAVPAEHMHAFAAAMKTRVGFEHLSAISCVDRIQENEFELVYHFWSYRDSVMVHATTRIDRDTATQPTITDLWQPAMFFERDIHEMFGVVFAGNEDLEKYILTDWNGPPPMRKDFVTREFAHTKFHYKDYEPAWDDRAKGGYHSNRAPADKSAVAAVGSGRIAGRSTDELEEAALPSDNAKGAAGGAAAADQAAEVTAKAGSAVGPDGSAADDVAGGPAAADQAAEVTAEASDGANDETAGRTGDDRPAFMSGPDGGKSIMPGADAPENREYNLFIGPNHPGIEGNFALKLTLEGDRIVRAKTEAGFLHRGFEKLMEERLYIQNIAIVCRICVPDPDPNEENYARAVEALAGIEVPRRAQFIRVLVLELSRMASHLFTFGGHAGTIGLYTMPNWSISDRDRILDLFEELAGGRVYHIYNMPGGVRRDLPQGFKQRVKDTMDYIESRLPEYDNLMFDSRLLRKRSMGIGVLPPEKAIEWGVTGPNLRAAGFAHDVRLDDPYEVYDELEFDIPVATDSDAFSRLMVRRRELEESIRIVRQVIDKIPEGPVWNKQPNPLKWKVPAGDAYVRTESSKGEYAYYMVSDGGTRPYRVHVRGASTTHGVHVLENLLVGTRIEDASQLMFSLDACPPEVDR